MCKKLLTSFLVLFLATEGSAQIKSILKNAQRKAEQKVNQKIEKKIDEAMDGKEKTGKKTEGSDSSGSAPNSSSEIESSDSDASVPQTLSSYSKFDFVPGEKIIALEDFSQDAIGDFPARWNTNGSAEVVTLSNIPGKWMKFQKVKTVSVIPDLFTELPENFTLEYDLVYNNWNKEYSYTRLIALSFTEVEKQDENMNRSATGPGALIVFNGNMGNGRMEIAQLSRTGNRTPLNNDRKMPVINPENNGKVMHVSIWRQKSRIRVYLNEQKVFDLPRILEPDQQLNHTRFFVQLSEDDDELYLSNVKLAVGGADTRNKLVTEGKFVTSGILFRTNSDAIQPESFGVLKDIANVLTENAVMRVKIIGHTDSDGSAETNQVLSQKRAEAVKKALMEQFKISGDRLETDGKGASQPAGPNDTPHGKAANRRVEFIKL